VLGLALYWRGERWTGFAFIILAYCEMIWATTISSRYFMSSQHEYDRLLNHKFAFSVLSLALLIVTWILLRRYEFRREAAEMLRA
jgi:hypothetical protein